MLKPNKLVFTNYDYKQVLQRQLRNVYFWPESVTVIKINEEHI